MSEQPYSPSDPSEMTEATPVNGDAPDAPSVTAPQGSAARQLLGMKGAKTGETSIWKIRLQLMKPITWIPLIWGVVCGAASSGTSTGRWNMSCFQRPAC
jgi:chlorophyll synthase